jgi:hypothetical protein
MMKEAIFAASCGRPRTLVVKLPMGAYLVTVGTLQSPPTQSALRIVLSEISKMCFESQNSNSIQP